MSVLHEGSEAEILTLGKQLAEDMKGEVPGVFGGDFWQGRILEWAMDDPEFKVDLFRLVDVLPILNSSRQVSQHVREYLLKEGRRLPGGMSTVLKAAWGGFTRGLASRVIKKQVAGMARRFIAGENPRRALPQLRRLHREGVGTTVDLLGEATLSDAEAWVYQERCLELIDHLAEQMGRWPEGAVNDRNHLGPIPRANISLKLSALDPNLNPVDPAGCVCRLKERVLPIFLRAREKNVFVNVDLEKWALHDITYDLFEEVLNHPDLKTWPHVGIVVQAYLRCARRDLERLLLLAHDRGVPCTVRLVKGAYWDYEVAHARQYGNACPVFLDKAETDAHYEHLTSMLLEHVDDLLPAFGSHNLRSLAHAIVQVERAGVPKEACEVQMLYGMAEPERKAMRSREYRVRIYTPVGELLPGMAYLVRRLLENTANSGFLRLTYREHRDIDALLSKPVPGGEAVETANMVRGDLDSPFENCPLTDFTDDRQRTGFARAVAEVEQRLPFEVPVVIGVPRRGGETRERHCPSEDGKLVASVTLATGEEAERAVETAMGAWPGWRSRPLRERAQLLEDLADRLEEDRFELAALQTFEEGKPWEEADADVAEAIDFCRYYARQALGELATRSLTRVPGEANELAYSGRGPTAVIAPWNFPLAILCGMSVAALVAGNTVLMKPSKQSSAVGHGLHTCMLEVGFPGDVVLFLPGKGEIIGETLVEHPLVAQIAFTGSREVGLEVLEKAAVVRPGQPQLKRVVCEMGGKNAVIIDDDADLDEAVSGVMRSAFGYAGQKCSAASRVIGVGGAYEPFVSRLVEACRSLPIAPAHSPACRLGPVIDVESRERLREIIENPGEGAQLLFRGVVPAGGLYVGPTVFAVQEKHHRLMQEELFGPIVSVMKVEDFAEALDVAVSTEYALTGAVYSRSPGHLEEARREFRVGNLYLNRGCTGALVDRQPFGGFAMSGLGTKAGGPGYLLNFAEPRNITENTMRRGFTPEISW